MEEIKFKSLEELYKRIYPALNSKVKELKRENINFINEEDIWKSLKDNKWINTKTLCLADIVDDILNTNKSFFIDYISKKKELEKKNTRKGGESII